MRSCVHVGIACCVASCGQNKQHGVVFKMSVVSGRDIGAFSFFPRESEILLSPNTRFVVARGLYKDDDGYSCVDLLESQGALLAS